jgi:glycosidase
VRRALIRVFQHWIEVGDFDGFRIDTLKHVEHDFWREFAPAMRQHAAALGKQRFLMFGEAFSGADRLLSSYTEENQVDSVFYFSQKYRVIDNVFRDGGPTTEIELLHKEREQRYSATPQPGGIGVAPRDALINFIDNHDVERFLHRGTPSALRVALAYLLTSVGIPCLYYGTEQQLHGGNDPSNREDLWRGNARDGLPPYDTQNATFKLIRALADLRKQYAPLRRGDFKIRWTTASVGAEPDAGTFGFERSLAGETVLVVLNAAACSGARTSSTTTGSGGAMQTSFTPGTTLKNVLEDEDPEDSFTVGAEGRVAVRVPCHGVKVLVRQ